MFFASVQSRIIAKTIYVDNGIGCKLWVGARKSSGYGVMKVTFPDGRRLNRGVHKLMFMCYNRIVCLPEGLEMSHLCHWENPTDGLLTGKRAK